MLQFAEFIAENLGLPENGLRELIGENSLFLRRKVAFCCREEQLLVVADYRQLLPEGLDGEAFALSDGCYGMLCPLSGSNIAVLQSVVDVLSPRPVQQNLSFGTFEKGKMPLFRADSQEELEKVILTVFRQGWQEGFAVTSAELSGNHILPLFVPAFSDAVPSERHVAEYSKNTFILKEGTLYFSPEMLARCVQRYSKTVHIFDSCRKQMVVALPEDVCPEELLFLNRELWLGKGKHPIILLPASADTPSFKSGNETYFLFSGKRK